MNETKIKKLIGATATWKGAPNDAKEEFIKHMEDRQYGCDALTQAWAWFLSGWYSKDGQGQQRITALQAEKERLAGEVGRLGKTIASLQEIAHERNKQLDAMHWVWCDGGCIRGTYRWNPGELTEAIILIAEANTLRLRRWWKNKEFHKKWNSMTEDDRLSWLEKQHTTQEPSDETI